MTTKRQAPAGRDIGHPVFSQPQPTADPTTFRVKHASDGAAYKEIDALNKEHKLAPLPFPTPRGGVEPTLTLEQVLGGNQAAADAVQQITSHGQIVFHSTGDCGSTIGPATQSQVTDKMLSDFNEAVLGEVPSFNLLLGDIVYSFGETQYYYDQFYEPYREYPAPVLAAAGNHDGMVSPLAHAKSLQAFLANFCSSGFTVTPEAGGLSRTAQIQPGVFFTFEAPFVRILVLYSNTLEDPGVIADANIGSSQIKFLRAALQRVKADLAGHAHNYQRFTRTRRNGQEVPYLVCGNGGHALQKIPGDATLRAPQVIQKASGTVDQIVLENYDDQDFGYLRVVASAAQLRVEYHPASDGARAKTPDDFVTVDLASRKLVHFSARDLGRPQMAAEIHQERTQRAKRTKKP
jgi:Calcineurin-like phosphoesterase